MSGPGKGGEIVLAHQHICRRLHLADVQRLTDNKARDVYPRFSPDGSLIAFSSNRDGNYDVFVVPVTGGRPRQFTFHTADDNVVGWSPDGKKVMFTSARGKGARGPR